MKLLFILLLISIHFIQPNEVSFNKVMEDLENLEAYIKEYINEKSYTGSSLTHLIVCYIRLGAYSSSEWSIAGGQIPDDLASYISSKDKEEGTSAQKTQTYRVITTPNGDKIDFVHMFAVMNGIENGNSFSSNYAHLVGWGGDTEQLLEDIMNIEGDLESIMNQAKNNYFRIKGGFDEADLISDLDGPILLDSKDDNNNFADIMKDYYSNKENNKNRVNKFVELTFPNLLNKIDRETFRNEIYKIYNNDMLISILECKKGIRNGFLGCLLAGDIKEQYIQHQKAAVYVVSDYLFENYEIIIPKEEKKEEEKETEKLKEESKVQEKEKKKEEDNIDKKDVEKEKEEEVVDKKEKEKEKGEPREEERLKEDKGQEKGEEANKIIEELEPNNNNTYFDYNTYIKQNLIHLFLLLGFIFY